MIFKKLETYLRNSREDENIETPPDFEDIPIEVFGTAEERQQRFISLNKKIEEEIDKSGMSQEMFTEKLEKTKDFMKSMVLYHGTQAENIGEIFRKKSDLYSLDQLPFNKSG